MAIVMITSSVNGQSPNFKLIVSMRTMYRYPQVYNDICILLECQKGLHRFLPNMISTDVNYCSNTSDQFPQLLFRNYVPFLNQCLRKVQCWNWGRDLLNGPACTRSWAYSIGLTAGLLADQLCRGLPFGDIQWLLSQWGLTLVSTGTRSNRSTSRIGHFKSVLNTILA